MTSDGNHSPCLYGLTVLECLCMIRISSKVASIGKSEIYIHINYYTEFITYYVYMYTVHTCLIIDRISIEQNRNYSLCKRHLGISVFKHHRHNHGLFNFLLLIATNNDTSVGRCNLISLQICSHNKSMFSHPLSKTVVVLLEHRLLISLLIFAARAFTVSPENLFTTDLAAEG